MAARTPLRCTCGGGQAHHDVSDTCWCPQCMTKPEQERCTQFERVTPPPTPKAESPVAAVPKALRARKGVAEDATEPDTGLPAEQTVRRKAFDAIRAAGSYGATDDEVESELGGQQRAVVEARQSLLREQLIRFSGRRRPTRYEHSSPVWVAAPMTDAKEPSAEEVPEQGSLFDG